MFFFLEKKNAKRYKTGHVVDPPDEMGNEPEALGEVVGTSEEDENSRETSLLQTVGGM